MSTCTRCGAPLDPAAPRCLACEPTRPRRRPVRGWVDRGVLLGVVVGALAGVAVGVGVAYANGWQAREALSLAVGLAFAGSGLCALLAAIWRSLLRPVLLALFAPKRFERE